jgi:hypothetical protein
MGPKMDFSSLRYFELPSAQPFRPALVDPTAEKPRICHSMDNRVDIRW